MFSTEKTRKEVEMVITVSERWRQTGKKILLAALILLGLAPICYPYIVGDRAPQLFTLTAFFVVVPSFAILMAFHQAASMAVMHRYWALTMSVVPAHLIAGFCFCIPQIATYEYLQTLGGATLFFLFFQIWMQFDELFEKPVPQQNPAP